MNNEEQTATSSDSQPTKKENTVNDKFGKFIKRDGKLYYISPTGEEYPAHESMTHDDIDD